MGESFEINPSGKIKAVNQWVTNLHRLTDKIFYMSTKKSITAIADRTTEGIKYDMKYEGELPVEGIWDWASWAQKEAERRVSLNFENSMHREKSFTDYEPDIIGIKRLKRYLAGQ
ncbi:MAG: hypothetical protein M1165_02830 [Candidatus Pacearchaeota archaeon]|nr:hypothetical protein [Candidatus Pacearchaeota archaeon]